jgi:hypothetical protein
MAGCRAHWPHRFRRATAIVMPSPATAEHARHTVLDGLARLRAAFPLEARVRRLGEPVQRGYARVLQRWLRAEVPTAALLDAETLAMLQDADALVAEPNGLACTPFSAVVTPLRVHLPAGAVHAMCAIDALSVARLAGAPSRLESSCVRCGAALHCRVEANGGLEHEEAGRMRVVWQDAGRGEARHAGRCRGIRFLCNDCTAPVDARCYSLPQAAAIGNAFFAFQLALLPLAGPAPPFA